MNGKEKCKALKEIRSKIAAENDIAFFVSECTHQGNCLGTCPKCEAELRYLERELSLRQNLGKAVAVLGISVGICTTLTACSPFNAIQNLIEKGNGNTDPEMLDGDIAYYPEDELMGLTALEESSYEE